MYTCTSVQVSPLHMQESVGVCTDVCIVDSIQSVERQQFKRSPDNLTGQVTYRLLSLSPQVQHHITILYYKI